MTWREKWQQAYEKASFYRTEKNSSEYWNQVARVGDSGLAGVEHYKLLCDYFLSMDIFDLKISLLDVGCGDGNYIESLIPYCNRIVALDYSKNMLEVCKKRLDNYIDDGVSISYVLNDFNEYETDEKFDIVLSCLNPSTYSPNALDKLMRLSKKYVVYFSMDSDISNAEEEPIYCGTNSVRFAEKYLNEREIQYTKISYDYSVEIKEGDVRNIPFAYIIVFCER